MLIFIHPHLHPRSLYLATQFPHHLYFMCMWSLFSGVIYNNNNFIILQFLVRVFTFLSLNLWFSYFGTFLSTWSISLLFTLFQLDITGMNYLTQERNSLIVNTDVIRIAVNSDGHWLATVEYRDDRESAIEQRLKFWKFDDEKQM